MPRNPSLHKKISCWNIIYWFVVFFSLVWQRFAAFSYFFLPQEHVLNMEQLGNFPTCFGERAHGEAGGAGIRLRGKLEDSKQIHVFQCPGRSPSCACEVPTLPPFCWFCWRCMERLSYAKPSFCVHGSLMLIVAPCSAREAWFLVSQCASHAKCGYRRRWRAGRLEFLPWPLDHFGPPDSRQSGAGCWSGSAWWAKMTDSCSLEHPCNQSSLTDLLKQIWKISPKICKLAT